MVFVPISWSSNNETWYTDVATMMRVHRNRNYKFVNNNKQPQAIKTYKMIINGVGASDLLMVGPLTMKLGTLIHHDKEKQKIQGCKQQQAASSKKDF